MKRLACSMAVGMNDGIDGCVGDAVAGDPGQVRSAALDLGTPTEHSVPTYDGGSTRRLVKALIYFVR